MKYVTFKQLKIKNFLSIGDEEVVIDFKKGVHIITGVNRDKEDRRNGVGKSTIADAIYFAIFGVCLRDIKKDLISNNVTNNQCEVQLEFNVNSSIGNDDFVIVRQLNPSKLYVFKNTVDKTRDSISNTNDYISEVLSSSQEIFQNCVIMTLNSTIPFMAKGKVEKRKFIEQIFNLQIFSQMLTKLRDEYNEVKNSFDIEIAKHDEVKDVVDALQKKKASSIIEREGKAAGIQQKIDANIAKIDIFRSKLTEQSDIQSSIDIKLRQIEELNKKLNPEKVEAAVIEFTEIYSKKRQRERDYDQAGTSEDICPTCLRPLALCDKDDLINKKAVIKIDIETLNKDVEAKKIERDRLRNESDIIIKARSKVVSDRQELQNKLNSLAGIDNQIQGLLEVNKQLQDSILTVDSTGDTFDELIKVNTEKLTTIKNELDNIKKVINVLDTVKFVVSEEGVKSYLVKKILQSFNAKLGSYLKKLDSNSICVFNEYFEEEILNEKGKLSSYNNFSGAEKKAIDLACLFAFMDMRKAQGDVYYNISIYDELFDSSLDEKGVEIVLNILKERCDKYNECVLVISHRKESIKAATGDIIYLEKKNGITRKVSTISS
jgi:DNA repair exonuclease SbcCD ATPase subunit